MVWEIAAATVILLGWYFGSLQYNRRRARKAAAWIAAVFAGHGEVRTVERERLADFLIRIKVTPSLFRKTQVRAHFYPLQVPVLWLWQAIHRAPETLMFEADFDFPPSFTLQMQNQCWTACSPGARPPRATGARTRNQTLTIEAETIGPILLTTRAEAHREISSIMPVLVAARDCEVLSIRFQRQSPHFTACIPLSAVRMQPQHAPEFFEVLCELATCGSAFRF